MTDPKPSLHKLPYWPRWLNQQQAAAYLGVSAGTFASEQRAGVWPAPAQVPGRRLKLWDRKVLDAASDRLSGLSTGAIIEDVGHSRDPGYIKRLLEAAYDDEGRAKRNRPRSP